MYILLLVILHIIIAMTATVHVLLRKSDVRSAIGWLGVIWFSPFIGSALYAAFGINRVARRASHINRNSIGSTDTKKSKDALRLELGDNIDMLARIGTHVSGLALIGGNKVEPLKTGNEAYPQMLEAISSAKNSIALSTYIFRPDEVGMKFVAALAEARGRGVHVRVLVDGIGSGYFSSPIVAALQNRGVNTAQFMHVKRPWRMPFINLRNHKKLLVVDGKRSFTGGLNLGAENIGGRGGGLGVDDTHFLIEGPVVEQLMASFAADWHFTSGEVLDGPNWWPNMESKGSVVARGISSGPDEDIGKIEDIFAAAIGQARHRVRIVTPYFLPDEKLSSAINLAVLRGVDFDLLIPAVSDHITMDWAMRAHLAHLKADSVKCYKNPPPFDHSKLLTVDGRWCAIGSPNWDVRSLKLNFEFILEVYNLDFASDLDTLIDKKITQSVPLNLSEVEQRSALTKMRDAAARLFLPYL